MSVSKISDDCDEKFMKIKFDSHDELHLNKTIEIPSMIIVVKENYKCYQEFFFKWMSIKILSNIKMLYYY